MSTTHTKNAVLFRSSRTGSHLDCDIADVRGLAAPEPDGNTEDDRRLQQQVLCRMLDWLTGGRKASPSIVGARVIVLQHLVAGHRHHSQADLAKRLRVSEGRASQMLKAIRQLLAENL